MRLIQILRAPDAESGGSPLADEFVTVSRAELEELRARAERGHPSAPASDGPAAERDDLAERLKTREADFSREIAARERKAAELDRAYKSALRDRELATALVGKSL